MADWPLPYHGVPVTIHPWSHECVGGMMDEMTVAEYSSATDGLWTGAADMVFYYPFRLLGTIKMTGMWWVNGTAVAGSIDAGIYSEDGYKLTSTGLTAQAGTTTLQYAAAALVFGPGMFYLAFKSTSASSRFYRTSIASVSRARLCGLLEEVTGAGAVLPATWTPVAKTILYVHPFGLTIRADI